MKNKYFLIILVIFRNKDINNKYKYKYKQNVFLMGLFTIKEVIKVYD